MALQRKWLHVVALILHIVPPQISGHSFLHVFKAISASTEELYNVETKTIAVDFGKSNIYCRIEEALKGLEVGVLGKDTSSFKLTSWVLFFFLIDYETEARLS